MVFNSITFLIFVTIVLTVYYRLGHRGQNILLLGASYVFYGWWDWRFLGLLLFPRFSITGARSGWRISPISRSDEFFCRSV